MKKTILSLTSLFLSFIAFAQSGSSCNNSVFIDIQQECNISSYTIDFSSAAAIPASLLSCDVNDPNTGVWLDFTADVSESVTLTFTEVLEFAIFDSCGGTEIICSGSPMNTAVVNNLVDGTNYKVVVYKDNATTGNTTVCIQPTAGCAEPINSFARLMTNNTAELIWEAGGTRAVQYELEIGTVGFTPSGIPTNTSPTTSFTASSLAENTRYAYYVRADCGAGDKSNFIGPTTFRTLCNPITPNYLEEFDSFVPVCWTVAETGTLTDGPSDFSTSLWSQEEFAHQLSTGLGAVNINLIGTGINSWLLSPTLDLSTGGYELNIDVALTNFNSTAADMMDSDDEVVLAYTIDGSSWLRLKTWSSGSEPSELGETYNNELTNLNGENSVRFAIYATTGTVDGGRDYDFHVDNFEVATPPTCLQVTDVTILNVTTTTATINFNSQNDNSNGTFEYAVTPRLAGEPTSPTASIENSSLPANMPNATFEIGNGTTTGPALQPQTTYDIYVREECSPGDFGAWSTLSVFTTLCDAVTTTFPINVNFANHVPNACWNESGSGNLIQGPQTRGSSEWRGGRGYRNLEDAVVPSNVIRLQETGDNEWLISEIYDLSGAGNDFLTVDVAVTEWQLNGSSFASQSSNMGVDDQVVLLVTEDDGNTWTSLRTWNQNNRPLTTGSRSIIDISGYSGLTQFAFYGTNGDVDDLGIDLDFHVGKFTIDATASSSSFDLDNSVKLYPNPVAGSQLNLEFAQYSEGDVDIVIYNTQGQQMFHSSIIAQPTVTISGIDAFSNGLYFMKISNGSVETTLKFIVQ
jgi:hypothetical protein